MCQDVLQFLGLTVMSDVFCINSNIYRRSRRLTIRVVWLRFQVQVVRILLTGSTMESSMTKTERDIPEGKKHSAHRGSRLVFIRSRLERSRWSAVTSLYTTSSVRTCVLIDRKTQIQQLKKKKKKIQELQYLDAWLMIAVSGSLPVWIWIPLPKSRDNMLPRAPDVNVITEILDHSPLGDVQNDLN